jgi:hypothetical protein
MVYSIARLSEEWAHCVEHDERPWSVIVSSSSLSFFSQVSLGHSIHTALLDNTRVLSGRPRAMGSL